MPIMMHLKSSYAGYILTFPFIYLPVVSAHSRWSCPEPRSPSTSIKDGPCGDDTTNNFVSSGDTAEIRPGPLRVLFEESIYHMGAPFRISLSGDGTDAEACTLLDHIPHNDLAVRPNFRDDSTYTQYAVTIDIPDVNCERCSLHLSNPMTDKIGDAGSPFGIGCTDPDGTCFSVYYSCTKPFRIIGTSSATTRSQYQCPYDAGSGPVDWPTSWIGDNGESVDASVPGVYRRESSIWNENDFTLETAPMRYREDAGGLCGKSADAAEENIEEGTQPPTDSPTFRPIDINKPHDVPPEMLDSSPTSSPQTKAPVQQHSSNLSSSAASLLLSLQGDVGLAIMGSLCAFFAINAYDF